MSDRRYVNLRVTPQKWENEYFGDFEAPIALYPAPSRPTPTPTRTPTPTPTPSVTPSITPTITPTSSVTPTVTPTSSVTPTVTPSSSPIPVTPSITPTQSATPSVTPSITPTQTITPTQSVTPTSSVTPTPTVTPTFTPTPSSSPLPQYNILAENTDEILTEGADELITQDGVSIAESINMSNFEQGVGIVVVDGDTSTTLIDAVVTQDDYTSGATFDNSVNLEFTWTKYVSTDEVYTIKVYEDEGGSLGRLLEESSAQGAGSYTYTGNTDVHIRASVGTSNGNVLNKTSSASVPFTYLGNSYLTNTVIQQWGIDGTTPWGSNQYQTGVLTSSDPVYQYKRVFVRTSLGAWTHYQYRFDTGVWSSIGTISTGTSVYGTQDQSTLVDNL